MNKKPGLSNKENISTNKSSIDVTVRLPKDWAEHLNYLEKTTSKSKNYYIRESLKRYLEDLEDLQIGSERLKKKNKVYYTSEELDKKLGL